MDTASGAGVWSDLAADRAGADERLFRAFVRGKGRGVDVRAVRGVVRTARGMLGLDATFCDIDLVRHADGYEVVVWYRFPPAAGTDKSALEAVSFLVDTPTSATCLRPRSDPPNRRRPTGADLGTRIRRGGITSALHAPGAATHP